MKAKKLITILIFAFTSCTSLKYPPNEFRGVWVATVVNIDWPKSGDDDAEKQKSDFIKLLNFYEELNFNALIVQIRTAGDTFYPSQLNPWSRFLTGKEGVSKKGFEDPLQWMIDQTHQRGMEFHAWLNPYRATFDLDTTILAKTHDFYQHPDWMLKYGKKYYYNPGIPKVWKHVTKVVKEVVMNYDVDGIHFDDYFYPYQIVGETFPDSLTYSQYGLENQNLDDWRRSNVDSLVKNVHHTIKSYTPWVQFGISPFGVWKNKSTDPLGSDTKAGQTTYENLYADPLLWMKQAWLDYIAPQAYWSMDYPAASHKKITEWWATHTTNTRLYMGNGAYKIRNNADKAWNKEKELPLQLRLSRSIPKVEGNVFFSAKSLPQHPTVTKKIKRKFYALPAEIPKYSYVSKQTISDPVIISNELGSREQRICISHYNALPRYLSIYKINPGKRRLRQLLKKVYLPKNESRHCFTLESSSKNMELMVKDAFGNESQPIPIPN
ncbi:MAG: family 10 glycosylhydrolase [Bacteroidota bacterium]